MSAPADLLTNPLAQRGMDYYRPDWWAEQHRLIYGKPFTIIPPVRALYTERWPKVVVRKAAQVFVSEWLVNMALWCADTMQGERGKSLYVFPKERQLGDFSTDRIQKAIDESDYLRPRCSGNVGLKLVGKGALYLRGSTNRQQMISVDSDLLLFDEVAEFPSGTVDTFERRTSSSLLNWMRAGSTPRFPSDEHGVLWEMSTQCHYHVRCSHCATWQALDVDTHLDAERAMVICAHCRGDMSMDRLCEGRWIERKPGAPWHGYHLSKLLSPRASLVSLADKYLAVLEGRADTKQTQEFWNSDAGKAYLPEGGHLSPDDLDACIDHDYVAPAVATHAVMGIDVGARLHVRVDLPGVDGARARLLYAGTVKYWGAREAAEAGDPNGESLDSLMTRYDVDRCVIDANPETTKAREFSSRWRGRVWLCYFVQMESNAPDILVWKSEDRKIQASRTAILDTMIGRVRQRRISYPRNARSLGGAVDAAGMGEFYRHMLSPVRILVRNAQDVEIARYQQNGTDHLAFADVYCLIASMRGGLGMPDWPNAQELPAHELRSLEDDLPLQPDHKIRKAEPDEYEYTDMAELIAMDKPRGTAHNGNGHKPPPLDFTDCTLA